MTTGYARDQLDRMEEMFAKRLPRLPAEKDKRRLPIADAVSAAGSPFGVWVRLHVEAGDFLLLFLNPVVLMFLFQGINECAMDAAGGMAKPAS